MDGTTLRPGDEAQLAEAVAWAAAEGKTLDVAGQGSKAGLGRPVAADFRLETTGIAGVVLYEPEELVLTARAGTPQAEVEALLAQRRQRLAFEPADLGPLWGGPAGRGTLGGTFAAALSGPARLRNGAARDHLLGFRAVGGGGQVFKSGGRVVKNVTGFDLSKLMAGSMGTLGVLTELSVKVLPVPEKTRTVLVLGAEDDAAARAMALATGSAHDVVAAAHLPADVAAASAVDLVSGTGKSVTALRLEGPAASVEFRCRALRELLADVGRGEELHSRNSEILWREVRDVSYFAGAECAVGDGQVWRLSVAPLEGPRAAAAIRAELGGHLFYDWAGGQVWLCLDPRADAGHQVVRRAVAGAGGHATLVRADAAVRAAVPVFQPQAAPLAALARRVKDQLDPAGILSPGRMGGGG
ncbi:MAG: glycolate oxidase subunit GlcE [Hyphomicrobiales bacterium]|nr:glycolate oxidase subunit GlcE [Hyphomicrobiales bacterium]